MSLIIGQQCDLPGLFSALHPLEFMNNNMETLHTAETVTMDKCVVCSVVYAGVYLLCCLCVSVDQRDLYGNISSDT